MITIDFMGNSEYACIVENWLIDCENEKGCGINKKHVTEPFVGVI